ASIPEPHNRFTVTAGVSTLNPAFKPTCRAPYSASALVCITFPKIAWSKSLASTPDRLIASLEACAARSIADTSENAPAYRAIGVLAPATITTSVGNILDLPVLRAEQLQ